MAVSGMATRERSVTRRRLPWAEMPTPPPMTMPSMNETKGLGKLSIAAFMRYSAAQNSIGSPDLAMTTVRRARTSPPAHRPRSPAPWIETAVTLSSRAQLSSCAATEPTIWPFSTLMTLGRFSMIRPR